MRAIILTKAQRGWLCEVVILCNTDTQFTSMPLPYATESRWLVLAFLKGIVGAFLERRRIEGMSEAGRKAKGWD